MFRFIKREAMVTSVPYDYYYSSSTTIMLQELIWIGSIVFIVELEQLAGHREQVVFLQDLG